MTKEQVYSKMEEVLLPVFKQAVELYKYLNNDQDFFKEDYNSVRLLSMALVSLAIKEVNAKSGTTDEKKEAIHDMNYWESYFIKDGQRQQAGCYHDWKDIKKFRMEICHATNIPVDDNYETRYLGAFRRDVQLWNRKEPLISTSGDILDWSKMQDSDVFLEVVRRDYDKKEDIARKKEKIKEFCDLQKDKRDKSFENKKEQIKMRLHEREQGGIDAKISGVVANDELAKIHDSIGTITPEKAKTLSPILKQAILERRKN